MLDAIDLITLIENNWMLCYPLIGTNSKEDLIVRIDEYDPRNPKYQLVIINRPVIETFLCPTNNNRNVVRIEQSIVIEVNVKFTRYDAETIANMRQDFKNIKAEVNRIINHYRFNNVGKVIHIDSWIDGRISHGYGVEIEPLGIVSRMTMHIVEYKGD